MPKDKTYSWYHSSNSNGFFFQQLLFHFFPMDLTYQTLAFSPSRKLELWRYLSYSLLHNGVGHVCTNLILQMIIGFTLETEGKTMNFNSTVAEKCFNLKLDTWTCWWFTWVAFLVDRLQLAFRRETFHWWLVPVLESTACWRVMCRIFAW